MICPHCNSAYNDNFAFCPYCGTKKPEPKTCPQCGLVSNEYSFCPNCGEKLLNDSELKAYKIREEKRKREEEERRRKEEERKREEKRKREEAEERKRLKELWGDQYNVYLYLGKHHFDNGWVEDNVYEYVEEYHVTTLSELIRIIKHFEEMYEDDDFY